MNKKTNPSQISFQKSSMKVCKSFTALVLVVLLGACGDLSGASTANPKKPLPVDTFNGLVVPPDPGKLSDKTIEGVDTDKNGIRDEIDRYIAQKYGSEKTKFAAAQELAKTDQLLLTTPTTDINAATTAMHASADSGVCHARKFRNDDLVGSRMMNDMVLQSFNTKARQKKYQEIAFKVGMFTRSTSAAICK